jgi:hypothetical protein
MQNPALDKFPSHFSFLAGYWLLNQCKIRLQTVPMLYTLCPPAANAVHLAGSSLRFDLPYALCWKIELKPNTVHILNRDICVFTEILPQAADKYIKATAIEIIILAPDIFQDV